MVTIPAETRQKFRWYRETPRAIFDNFNLMTLSAEERGVYFSMRLCAWDMGEAPCQADKLGFHTRLDKELLERIAPKLFDLNLFTLTADGSHFFVPEFEEQMMQNMESLESKRAGGRRGGIKSASARAERAGRRTRRERAYLEGAANQVVDAANDECAQGDGQGGPQAPSSPSTIVSSDSSTVWSVKKGNNKKLSEEQSEWVDDMNQHDSEFPMPIRNGRG